MDDVKNAAPTVEADRVFSRPMGDVADFRFNGQVATVFDDMVSRSVPFYAEIQRMITEIAADYAVPGTRVYDFGCATSTTFEALDPVLPAGIEFVGLDSSQEMLDRCRVKLEAACMKRTLGLECADLNQGAAIENASVALMILTLQFIRPLNRERLMRDVHRGLNGNGCLILVEKVLGEDSLFNRQFIKYYYDFKRRNGYSDLEIAQKREALENVLIPYKLLENRELLKAVGFRYVDVFFKWYNFCGIVAVK
ncbi:MAG TPA: carboxy-S-adenosyl-L-methionine synthase CmoA [Usitatibacter sp.]|nr:carboxy-S-adenosyl-L-methionine synthase CmoA [Usitatibacter sp.]